MTFPSTTGFQARLALVALLSLSAFCIWKSHSLRRRRRRLSFPPIPNHERPAKVFFLSQTGTSESLAQRLAARLSADGVAADLVDPRHYEPEDLPKETLVFFVVSTWEDGKPPPNAAFLARWLEESAADFRVGALLLSLCRFAVFGVGSRAYGSTFNAAARSLARWMKALGAVEMMPLWEGNIDEGEVGKEFGRWSDCVVSLMKGERSLTNGAMGEEIDELEEDQQFDEDEGVGQAAEEDIIDLEDIAGKAPSKNSKGEPMKENGRIKEMVTPIVRKNLEKQGYKIIGSHSGVKICRWTKSQLRGRGGCYKHSFYGIESHRCMEATPSLACANKCVFCWRHHTNPVGKDWRWKMDDPLVIVEAAIDQHTQMIKQMKGVPGVKEEILLEGLSPRHCALSLVGEPIMYPEINSLVEELHGRHISTFLVTNAQFPDRIKMLKPVTQLYVSVDAATKESLKAVDRPLFGDFWERFIDSLRALRDKRQRTVYRLTLVKGWNAEDVDAYANLLSLGEPDLIEIKGVTYCGSTATSKLTMENVPWHSDVKAFSEALAIRSNGAYEVACEHAHSCCVLLAKVNTFKINGHWHTWIDYDRFHELVASGKPFGTIDYMAPTPSWAVYGAEEGGFDPRQSRFRKERRHGDAAMKDKLATSNLG
ncbi:hypothetical protein HPP92_012274 [Vanilla planifolia]|uniref:tRNA 4-demethylwyosine synthase (AdoMet-dependent) n=1 Tax=Vanilla planifolia TaxID=51239 RepID=A0A835QX83_VANPL|nr:hypothetical protein HPP92_012274 [Vanilla planifolia]